jgi:hypothetical protein
MDDESMAMDGERTANGPLDHKSTTDRIDHGSTTDPPRIDRALTAY